MSELSSPPPVNADPPPARPHPAWPGWVAWGVIALAVAFVLLSQAAPELRGRKARTGTADAQFILVGKYSVGAHTLTSVSRGPATQTTQPSASATDVALIRQLDEVAKSDRNRIQAAVVAGELLGSSAALQRLDQLDPATLSDSQKQDLDALRRVYTGGADSLEPAQRDQLVESLDFFGRLALAHGQPDSNPLRRAVLAESRKTALIFGGAMVAGIIALLLGLVLLVVGIVLFATGTLRRLYVPQPSDNTIYVEMFAVYLVSFLLLSVIVSLAMEGFSLGSSWILTAAVPIAFAWGIYRGTGWSEMRQRLGWHGGRGWHVEIPMGIAGYLAGLPIVFCGLLITSFLIRFTDSTPTHPIISEPAGSALQVLNLYGIAALWAPIIEETMFRGALFHHMRRRWNWLISAAVVALIFAAVHPQGWASIPVLGSIALVLAALREWRGSILAPMVAHACNNFVMISLLVSLK